MITMIAHLKVSPLNAPAFTALMTRVRDQVHAHEPDVLYYEFASSADEPDTFVVIEVYRDGAAHAAHMAAPWVQESLPVSLGLIEGAPHIRQYITPETQPVRRTVGVSEDD